jgi:hypothetical protein
MGLNKGRSGFLPLGFSVLLEIIGIFYIAVRECGFDLEPPVLFAVYLLIGVILFLTSGLLYVEIFEISKSKGKKESS